MFKPCKFVANKIGETSSYSEKKAEIDITEIITTSKYYHIISHL